MTTRRTFTFAAIGTALAAASSVSGAVLAFVLGPLRRRAAQEPVASRPRPGFGLRELCAPGRPGRKRSLVERTRRGRLHDAPREGAFRDRPGREVRVGPRGSRHDVQPPRLRRLVGWRAKRVPLPLPRRRLRTRWRRAGRSAAEAARRACRSSCRADACSSTRRRSTREESSSSFSSRGPASPRSGARSPTSPSPSGAPGSSRWGPRRSPCSSSSSSRASRSRSRTRPRRTTRGKA